VRTKEQWRGFTEVGAAASRLNALVRQAMLDAGVPCVTLQPSASAMCVDGQIESLELVPVEHALAAGLVPIVHGDIAFDQVLGGTIISTEEIMDFMAARLEPRWFLLAGETKGVLDKNGRVIPHITPANIESFATSLMGSRGTDVTGGMFSKVQQMVSLVDRQPKIVIRIFSGLDPGSIRGALLQETGIGGTIIRH
jgi:isopentenyl phosphate kinase